MPKNDIAIVKLEESVEMSDSIEAACIATDYDEIDTDSGTVVTSGWGSIVECSRRDRCEIPNILHGTEMFLLSRPMCKNHMDEEMPGLGDAVTDAMICANDHSRICKGDGGGRYLILFPGYINI